MAAKSTTLDEIRDELNLNYKFRFNDVSKKVEYIRLEESENLYRPLTDYFINSLWAELNDNDVSVSINKLMSLLTSNFSKKVDPIRRYFDNLPPYTPINGAKSGVTHTPSPIQKLAATVRVAGSPAETEKKANERFEDYLRRWLVASVANQYNLEVNTNHTMLVFRGTQGAFKTTWLQNLCPEELKQGYLFTGTLDPKSKDSEALLAHTFIYNIDDQLTGITKKDYNAIKQTITKDFVKIRMPYGKVVEHMPRRTNFVASVNDSEFLNDPSGSRRFLPFEIISIDIEKSKKLCIDDVYSEAKHFFELSKLGKYRYYFNREEVDRLNEINEDFRTLSIEEQTMKALYLLPSDYVTLPIEDQQKYMLVKHLHKDLCNEITISNASGFRVNKKAVSDSIVKLRFTEALKNGRIAPNPYPVKHYEIYLLKPECR